MPSLSEIKVADDRLTACLIAFDGQHHRSTASIGKQPTTPMVVNT